MKRFFSKNSDVAPEHCNFSKKMEMLFFNETAFPFGQSWTVILWLWLWFDLGLNSAFCLMGLQNILGSTLRYVFRKRNWWWSGFSMPRPHLSTSGCLLLMLDLRFAPFSLNLKLDYFLFKFDRNYVETYIKNNGPCCCRWSWGKPQVCISSMQLSVQIWTFGCCHSFN